MSFTAVVQISKCHLQFCYFVKSLLPRPYPVTTFHVFVASPFVQKQQEGRQTDRHGERVAPLSTCSCFVVIHHPFCVIFLPCMIRFSYIMWSFFLCRCGKTSWAWRLFVPAMKGDGIITSPLTQAASELEYCCISQQGCHCVTLKIRPQVRKVSAVSIFFAVKSDHNGELEYFTAIAIYFSVKSDRNGELACCLLLHH